MDRWTSDTLVEKQAKRIIQLREGGYGRRRAAAVITEETGITCTPGALSVAVEKLGLPTTLPSTHSPVVIKDVSDQDPDEATIPIEELIEQRINAAERKKIKATAHTRELELPPEPFAIMVFGDPHVDNEGCDWSSLLDHVKLVQSTEGILAACVGDMQDNWIGRLQRLYADSSMKASDGWRLSEWFLESMQWLALVGGNHDQWAHAPGVDPLKWLSKKAKVMCFANDEIRMSFHWKGRPDLEPIVFVMRHDFQGRSWFHPTHGPNKAAMLDGKCHILAGGHIHQWGQLSTEQRHQRVTHALRVRGYKRDDEHARALGFAEQTYGEAALLVIDPTADEPGRTSIFWDLNRGCEYLSFLRGE